MTSEILVTLSIGLVVLSTWGLLGVLRSTFECTPLRDEPEVRRPMDSSSMRTVLQRSDMAA